MMKKFILLFSVVFSSVSLIAQAGDPHKILGIWKSPSRELMIKIDKVGDHFQGRIVWLQTSGANQPALDIHNPDERLQKMPLKGNKVIKDLSFNATKIAWEGGTFYHYEEGKLYNCQITLQSDDKIKITSYLHDQQEGIVETWERQ
jgi:uncharacterized protein (DUF2147 family)